ncbi:helix-turn-helix transcriptional regulator [Zoogloea sp.]|uniref:helix-turn-helix transcriptional regulator n=1 Tax=Zoogloea sp. TaxID=49181 RepID=UPI0035AF9779
MKSAQQLPAGTTADVPEKLLTTDELATWLGIRRCTLEKARSTRLGDFPPFLRIGHAIRYRRSDIEVWLRQRTFNTDGSQA